MFSPQDDTVLYDRQVWGAISQLTEVSLNSSGATFQAFTHNDWGSFDEFGTQPNWGPSDDAPPAQAPEVSLPVVLPIVGCVVAGAVLVTRRRRARTKSA